MRIDDEGAAEIAGRSRGTPRIANRLLRRVRDYAEVRAGGSIDVATARAGLALFGVDEAGLDKVDRAILGALCRHFNGGPVGLSTLAIAVGEEPETVETVAEPQVAPLLTAPPVASDPSGAAVTEIAIEVELPDGARVRVGSGAGA